jgi:hypothetical protein
VRFWRRGPRRSDSSSAFEKKFRAFSVSCRDNRRRKLLMTTCAVEAGEEARGCELRTTASRMATFKLGPWGSSGGSSKHKCSRSSSQKIAMAGYGYLRADEGRGDSGPK